MSSNIYTQRICQYCDKEFTARTTATKYCSHKCNSRDYKKRLKEKNIKRSENETKRNKLKALVYVQNKEILTLKEASILLGISRTTLYRMRKDGIIQFTQIGNRKYVLRKSIYLLIGYPDVDNQGVFLKNIVKNS
jgi:excisionase family DNA binding protein